MWVDMGHAGSLKVFFFFFKWWMKMNYLKHNQAHVLSASSWDFCYLLLNFSIVVRRSNLCDITDHRDIDNNRTESRLSLRLSRRFSPIGLDLGLTQAVLLETGFEPPPMATVNPEQVPPSTLALFSTLTRTVCRLRADGGGRSPKSCENKLHCS